MPLAFVTKSQENWFSSVLTLRHSTRRVTVPLRWPILTYSSPCSQQKISVCRADYVLQCYKDHFSCYNVLCS